MQFFSHLTTLLVAAFALSAIAMPTSPIPPFPPTPDTNLTWETHPTWDVQAFIDGPILNITGTVEKVYDELLKLNPNYDEDFKDMALGDQDNVNALDPRDFNHDIQCWDHNRVWWKPIKEGVDYLAKVKGRPGLRAKTCGRVSCSWDSAIWWCNDNDHYFSLPGFYNIGQGASVIMALCAHPKPGFGHDAAGVLNHNDNWQTVVSLDHHKC